MVSALVIVVGILYLTGILEWLIRHYLGDAGSISKGVIQRMALNALALEKLVRNPWFGEGLREFARFSGNYWHRPVHNAYLQAATELGLPGAMVLVVMLAGFLTELAAAAFRKIDAAFVYIRPCLRSMIGLLFIMMGEPNFDNSNTWLFLALTQGILLSIAGRSDPGLALAIAPRNGITIARH